MSVQVAAHEDRAPRGLRGAVDQVAVNRLPANHVKALLHLLDAQFVLELMVIDEGPLEQIEVEARGVLRAVVQGQEGLLVVDLFVDPDRLRELGQLGEGPRCSPTGRGTAASSGRAASSSSSATSASP